MPSFQFEKREIPTITAGNVRSALAEGHGCLVVGAPGTGKSHAVRSAVNGAIWIDLISGPLQGAQLFVDLARQIDDGSALLSAVAGGDAKRATEIADRSIGSRCIVVDRAERLGRYDVEASRAASLDDPLQEVRAEESGQLIQWLVGRSQTRTVLVSRRPIREWGSEYRLFHGAPQDWTLKLKWAFGGSRDWPRLVDLVSRRPGGLTLARALVPLIGPRAFDELLDELELAKTAEDGQGATEVLRILARRLRDSASPAGRRVLDLVDAIDGGRRPFIESLLDSEGRAALAALVKSDLIEDRAERLTVLPILRDFTRESAAEDRALPLRDIATRMLTLVNDPSSLLPEDADTVLRAHRLFVACGDFIEARRTATLHLAGLIELAKKTSIQEQWLEASRQYDAILEMLEHSPGRVERPAGHRVLSYVLHYRAFNEQRANSSASDGVIADYQRSIELWPENALWRQHIIEAAVSRGDLQSAREQLTRAYEHVPEHPRRDTILRIRPAMRAMQCDAPLFALELTSKVGARSEQDEPDDPEAVERLAQLRQIWAQGFTVRGLPCSKGELYFRRPSKISLRPYYAAWNARAKDFSGAWGRGDDPLGAVTNLAEKMREVAYEFLSTPSHLLEDEDVERKSELLAYIDPLNSDIGLDHAAHRWLLGRIDGESFLPIQRSDFEPIALPAHVRGDYGERGLYFARVSVFRDGQPSGSVEVLEPAGSGRPLRELLDELATLRNPSEVIRRDT